MYAASAVVYCWFTATYPGLWTHTDEFVYRAAGLLARQHPADLYSVRLGEDGTLQLPFTYPPFAALLFGLASELSFAVWQTGLVIADLIALPAIGCLALIISGRRGIGRAAGALALAALAIWLQPVYMTMYFGQINLIVLALCMGDLALKDSSRWKGIGIAIAAGIKLTPLIFIPYLLASRRVRAGVVSLLTFAGSIAIGFAVLPTASRVYWGGEFAVPGDNPRREQNQSIYGVLLRLIHDPATAHKVWLAAAAVVGVAGLAIAVVASRRGLELLGITVCAATGLLVSEISWGHHWVWAVPALALTAGGASARRGGLPAVRTAGTVAIAAVFFMWPAFHQIWTVLPRGLRRIIPSVPGSADPAIFLETHAGFAAAGVLAIAGTAGYLWFSRHGEPGWFSRRREPGDTT
jgi:alpha-1,2-mannosyltransferase